jgi:hypothetical protein
MCHMRVEVSDRQKINAKNVVETAAMKNMLPRSQLIQFQVFCVVVKQAQRKNARRKWTLAPLSTAEAPDTERILYTWPLRATALLT